MDSLDKWMNDIDYIDDKILDLFEKRMEIVRKSAEYKKRHSFKKDNKAHDNEIKKKVKEDAVPEIAEYAQDLIVCMLNASNKYEQKIIKQK